ncbi:MAG TPA: nitrous oxide reductase accessory protein NosL [Flavobacteriaceae bacterium]|nr:nitrous oxide reductase accessory protein NosL [Flavobacteriaceae bacterium]
MKKIIFIFLAVITIASCSKNIDPIVYGEEACEFCMMTIVDQSHSAQLVTQKGKNFKFDATECMINYLEQENNEDDMLHLLSADYNNPGKMIDATEATFIISENIPSPMGEFLSALESKSVAEELQKQNGGNLYSWEEVKIQIKQHSKTQH